MRNVFGTGFHTIGIRVSLRSSEVLFRDVLIIQQGLFSFRSTASPVSPDLPNFRNSTAVDCQTRIPTELPSKIQISEVTFLGCPEVEHQECALNFIQLPIDK